MTIIPVNYNVNLTVSNDAGARFDDNSDDTYNFFSPTQSPTQGQNELRITDTPAELEGQVTTATQQSGMFYLSNVGGRGWYDDGILMLAVNGTVPENFRVHIRSSGYQWTPVPSGEYPAYEDVTHVTGALDEDFTGNDFLYGPQVWRPAPGAGNYYPVFYGQDMSDTANTFSILFIDLNAGILGTNTLSSPTYIGKTVTDNGTIRIDYTFENLQTFASFDAYGYTVSSNQGQGIRWTNRLLGTTAFSGWSVIGQAPVVVPLPGQSTAPTDPDGDGFYDDLNGNNELDFNDVQLFFRQMDWIAANEPITLFDFNNNGEIDFNDIQILFRSI
jgi:PKD repeat protein